MALKFEKIILNAANLGEVNPMPDLKNVSYIHAKFDTTENVSETDKLHFGKGGIQTILPYLSQDDYDREIKPKEFNAAILENDYLKAVFLPELGGRLWSLYNKKEQRELLYVNDIVQPCNLALRNAWIAGGVEWNLGIKGHSPFTCAPMFVAESVNSKGEPILSMYEFERIRELVYSINAYLDGDKLYIRTVVENLSDNTPYMYWWSNIAAPEEGVRVLTDADEMFSCVYEDNHYVIDKMAAPVFKGEDLSYPERAPHAGDVFFITNPSDKKWVASLEKDGFGLLQYSTAVLKGRKAFFWGKGKGGRNWNRFLTGSDRGYIEIQAGLMNTQLEHIPMTSNTTWEWTECYTSTKIDTNVLNGEWKKASEAIKQKLNTMPDPKNAPIELQNKKRIVSYGSGWGALEKRKISNYFEFPQSSLTSEQNVWICLKENGFLPNQNADIPPESYMITKNILNLLNSSLKNKQAEHWFTYYHIGIINYALDNINEAKKAWEKSNSLCENAWATRNLAMLYKNVYNNGEMAVKLIERAVLLCKNECRGLLCDAAKLMTEYGADNKWIALFGALSENLKSNGRLRLYTAIAYINIGEKEKAKLIVNENFIMSDIKEGELSISAVWSNLYGNEKPLPDHLNFRMYEVG